MSKTRSVEPKITDLVNGWLKEYKLDYKLEQESLNPQIDNALKNYASKSGGTGGNRVDAKLLLRDDKLRYFPVLIEYKGYKNSLVKLNTDGRVENINAKNENHYQNIQNYAVNGAVHYANALLQYTSYTEVIAIGVTGHTDEKGELKHQIGVYLVSPDNVGFGQEIGKFNDLSFLASKNFSKFIAEEVELLKLEPEELEKRKLIRELQIEKSLKKLNNSIYKTHWKLHQRAFASSAEKRYHMACLPVYFIACSP